MRWVFASAVLCLTSACGPEAALWVRVEAPLVVPTECDALTLTLRRDGDPTPAFERTFELLDGPQFPLTASFTADGEVPLDEPLRVHAEALLDGQRAQPWSAAEQVLTLKRGETTRVTLELCDCPEGT